MPDLADQASATPAHRNAAPLLTVVRGKKQLTGKSLRLSATFHSSFFLPCKAVDTKSASAQFGFPFAAGLTKISHSCRPIQRGPRLIQPAERSSRQRYGALSCWLGRHLLTGRKKPSLHSVARIGLRSTPFSVGRENRRPMPRT